MTEWIEKSVEGQFAQAVEWRRDFHAHPEVGYQETRTAARIAELLREMGLEDIREHVGGNGVTALIRGTRPGPQRVLALRADMDALPVTEETGLPFASQNPGVMHACGHDGHMAMAMGAAKILRQNRDKFSGTVKMIFQPAEEPAPTGGARAMIADGALENPKVDAVMGLHLWAGEGRPAGTVLVKRGVVTTVTDVMQIEVFGRAGHGSSPHLNVDALVAGCKIVDGLQTIVSRQVDPFDTAVISVGTFHSGTVENVTSGYTKMRASVRTLSVEMREHIKECVRNLLEGVEKSMGVATKLDYQDGYLSTVNDDGMVDLLLEVCREELGEGAARIVQRPETWGEDFSFFAERVPGVFAIVGAAYDDGREIYSNHHSRFDWDERAMKNGMKLLTGTAVKFLNA